MCELPVSAKMQTATMLRALAHNAGTNVGDHDLIIPVLAARQLPPHVKTRIARARKAHAAAYAADLAAYEAAILHAGDDFDPAKDAHDAAHYETRRDAELDRAITGELDAARVAAMKDNARAVLDAFHLNDDTARVAAIDRDAEPDRATARQIEAKVYSGKFPRR